MTTTFLSSQLDMDLRLALNHGETLFVDVSCDILPWLATDMAARTSLQQRIDDALRRLFTKGDKPQAWSSPGDVRSTLENAVAEFLEPLEIEARPRLKLVVEEHGKNALRGIMPPADGCVTWVQYDKHVLDNCEKLKVKDLGLDLSTPIIFSPVPERATGVLRVSPQTDFLLDAVAVCTPEGDLAKLKLATVVTTATKTIPLPEVPVRDYAALRETKVHLHLGNGRVLEVDVEATAADLSSPPVSLFVDMGSTYSKLIRVTMFTQLSGRYSKTQWDATVTVDIERLAAADKAATAIKAYEPRLTSSFTETWNLGNYSKKKLAKAGPSVVADWISGAIRRFAAEHGRRGKPVASVVWSFPDLTEGSIAIVAPKVAEQTDAVLLAGATVVSEHESLRSRFRGVLSTMAREAKLRKKEIEKALATNQEREERRDRAESRYRKAKKEYDDTFFLFRWFKDEPSRPDLSQYRPVNVPSLEAWHDAFMEIRADEELRDVMILDAGGYTLDVYCRRRDSLFGRSYPAGGQDLTARVREYLAKARGIDVNDFDLRDAEERKKDECLREEDTELSHLLREWTQETYERPLTQVVEWAKKNLDGAGMPLVLTGGAMDNRHLRDFIGDRFRAANVRVLVTNARHLTELIQSSGLLNDARLRRFRNITHGFQPQQNHGYVAYDVVGGLMEARLADASA